MIKEYNTYLFDFDGTLVDSHESLKRVFKGSYKSVGIEISDEDIWYLMRVRLQDGYERFKAPWDKVDIFAENIIRLLDEEETLKLTLLYKETVSTILELSKRGKTLGIVTSNSVKHVKEVLKYLDIDEKLFSCFVGNQEVKNHKPYPDPILKALEMLDISSENVCYVGDGLDDTRSALAANVEPILIDRLNEYDDQKLPVIKSLDELIK